MLSFAPRHLSIFLTDEFSLLAFASMIAALKSSNDHLGYQAYVWEVVTLEGQAVRSSCGTIMPAAHDVHFARKILDEKPPHLIVVLGAEKFLKPSTSVVNWLRKALSRGVRIAAIGSGTEMFARCGLLDGRRCAAHWKFLPSRAEDFPKVEFLDCYYTDRGPILTSAGEAATFDLFLEVVRQDFGDELRDAVNDLTLSGRPRTSDDRQFIALHKRLEKIKSPLLHVVGVMERTIHHPLSIDDIANSAGVSRRQIERLFLQHLGVTPAKFYSNLRIERAHSLLAHSGIPLLEVAMATGFVSRSHFAKAYRAVMGCSPKQTRLGHGSKRNPLISGAMRPRLQMSDSSD